MCKENIIWIFLYIFEFRRNIVKTLAAFIQRKTNIKTIPDLPTICPPFHSLTSLHKKGVGVRKVDELSRCEDSKLKKTANR